MSEDLIKRSDAIEVAKEFWYKPDIAGALAELPTIEPEQGEWIDKAISIIDDMQREGIIDYEQAWEFRMRARMKGADNE